MIRFPAFIVFIYSISIFSQQSKIDSLQKILLTQKNDTNKIKTLNALSWQFIFAGEYREAQKAAESALVLGKKQDQSNYSVRREIGKSYTVLGASFYNQGNFPEALKSHFAALKIREEIKDSAGIATAHNNIALVYSDQGNFDDALRENMLALAIRERIGDDYGVAMSHNNLGTVYYDQGKYEEALKEYLVYLKIKEEEGDLYTIAVTHNNIGLVYYHQGKNEEALNEYFKALKVREEIDDKHGIANLYIGIGSVYIRQGKADKGKAQLEKALAIGNEIGSLETIKYSYMGLAEADSARGDFQGSLKNFKLFIAYRDSLINEERTKETVQQQMQYEFDKKEALVKAEQEKKDLKSEEEKRQQRTITFFVAGCLLLVVVIAVFIFRSLQLNKKKNKIISEQKEIVERQKAIVEEKQKEILDSIHYAKRIQSALMTPESSVRKMLLKLNKK